MASTLHLRWLPLAVASVVLSSGCNFIVEPDRVQCTTDDDCTKRGPQFESAVCERSMCVKANPWRCVDLPPVPNPASTEPFKIHIHAQNIINLATVPPIKGASISFCTKLDDACSTPLNREPVITDENGDAEFEVPVGSTGTASFNGFIKITPADDPSVTDHTQKFTSTYYYNNPTIVSETTLSIQVAQFGGIELLTKRAGGEQQPGRGLLLLNAFNCAGAAGPGVVFSSDQADPETAIFYVRGGAPVIDTTGNQGTDTTGYGGFINLPAGVDQTGLFHVINGDVPEVERRIGTISVTARPDTLTISRLVPIGQSP